MDTLSGGRKVMTNFEKLLEMIEKMPCGSIHINKNNNRSYCESIRGYFYRSDTDEQIINKCEKANTIWEVQIYPDNPHSFYMEVGTDLEECCENIIKCLESHVQSSFIVKFENGNLVKEG
jgi:hypothetical protein